MLLKWVFSLLYRWDFDSGAPSRAETNDSWFLQDVAIRGAGFTRVGLEVHAGDELDEINVA